MNAAKHDSLTDLRFLPSARSLSGSCAPNGVHVSANGVTFPSDTYWAPFTEVQVRVQLSKGSTAGQWVHCNGVIVDCHGSKFKNRYEVAVAFLNPPKNIEAELRRIQRAHTDKTFAPSITKLTRVAS